MNTMKFLSFWLSRGFDGICPSAQGLMAPASSLVYEKKKHIYVVGERNILI